MGTEPVCNIKKLPLPRRWYFKRLLRQSSRGVFPKWLQQLGLIQAEAKKPIAPAKSPTWVLGPKKLGHSPLFSQAHKGARLEVVLPGLLTGTRYIFVQR